MAIEIQQKSLAQQLTETPFWVTAGPCSVDSEALAKETVLKAQLRGIPSVRLDVFKPRTNLYKGGERVYQGAREEGLAWFQIAWEHGIIPATEIMTPKQAESVRNVMGDDPNHNVFLWTGARTGVTEIVEEMASVFHGDERVMWGTKNTMAPDIDLWIGLAQAAQIGGGIPNERMLLIHRGFVGHENIRDKVKRSTPDLELAAQVARETGIRLIDDSAHSSTDAQIIMANSRKALVHPAISGGLFEVHDRPKESKTDPGITWIQLDELLLPQGILLGRQLQHINNGVVLAGNGFNGRL